MRKKPYSKQFKQISKLVKKLFKIKLFTYLFYALFILLLFPILLFYILQPKVSDDITYGITFSKKYATDLGMDWKETYITLLDDLNIKHLRLVAYWDEIEYEQGKYNYDDIKWQLDEANKRGADVIMLVGYKVVRYPECFAPEFWKEQDNELLKETVLLNYVRQSVLELKDHGAIKMWQVENEPFFPFGECKEIKKETLKKEIEVVRALDNRPILVQDSGEGGFWRPTYEMGDYLGISMYRKIWYDFWNVFMGNFIYFKYPLAHWTYKIKADLVGVPYQNIIVTELQAEPWGPGINSVLTQEEKDKSFDRHDFIDTINYAQKAGFSDFYLWGAEWWLWEKQINGNEFFYNTAKALFSQ